MTASEDEASVLFEGACLIISSKKCSGFFRVSPSFVTFSPTDKDPKKSFKITSIEYCKSQFLDSKETILTLLTKDLQCYDVSFSRRDDCRSFLSLLESVFISQRRIWVPQKRSFSSRVVSFGDVIGTSIWRISNVNEEFQICEGYPANVAVPNNFSDQSITFCAKIYNKSAFPILSTVYDSNKSCLLHSSFLKPSGINNMINRCFEVENMLSILAETIGSNSVTIYQINYAVPQSMLKEITSNIQNQANIAFSNNVLNSSGWPVGTPYKILDVDLLPINVLPICLALIMVSAGRVPLKTVANNAISGLSVDNASSLWLNNIFMCINTARKIAKKMVAEPVVELVIEESGFDYVLIISSLVRLLIEPKLRTINGFTSLINQEWVEKGHPFDSRNSKIFTEKIILFKKAAEDSYSPIFLTFLNCVKTLIQFYPQAFEFTENLLLYLFSTSYQYYIGDNAKSRRNLAIDEKCLVLWEFEEEEVRNILFKETLKPLTDLIYPQKMKLWDSVFLRNREGTDVISKSQLILQKFSSLAKELL